jgi:hypothetical protein
VQVAHNAATLLVSRLDDSNARGHELGVRGRIRHGRGDQLGEPRQSMLGVGRQRVRPTALGDQGAPHPPVDEHRRSQRRAALEAGRRGRVPHAVAQGVAAARQPGAGLHLEVAYAPPGHHQVGALGRQADEVDAARAEHAARLLADGIEHHPRLGALGHERRQAPQSRLLGGELVEVLARLRVRDRRRDQCCERAEAFQRIAGH